MWIGGWDTLRDHPKSHLVPHFSQLLRKQLSAFFLFYVRHPTCPKRSRRDRSAPTLFAARFVPARRSQPRRAFLRFVIPTGATAPFAVAQWRDRGTIQKPAISVKVPEAIPTPTFPIRAPATLRVSLILRDLLN